MSNLFIDIETAPTSNKSLIKSIRDSITAPGNYSKPESIQKWKDENLDAEADKLIRKTALDGLYGEIISIAWALDDGLVKCAIRKDRTEPETEVLRQFFNDLLHAKDSHGNRTAITRWVGHYITGFDLRFIWQRCVINQFMPPVRIPYDSKPWANDIFDTKVEWSGVGQYSGGSSLDKLSQVMIGRGKGEVNGSNVFDYWSRGEVDKVKLYNKQDVIDCRELYYRMNFIK
jgi:hypothetical protein